MFAISNIRYLSSGVRMKRLGGESTASGKMELRCLESGRRRMCREGSGSRTF